MNVRNAVFRFTTTEYRNLTIRAVLQAGMPLRLFKIFCKLTNPDIPDRNCYSSSFKPYEAHAAFNVLRASLKGRTLLGPEPLWVLYTLANQSLSLPGSFFEAGVYKGGTAKLLREVLKSGGSAKTLHLFDTFAGMPETDKAADLHRKGDFQDTSLAAVVSWVGQEGVTYHQGWLPDSFAGLENEMIALSHVDVDIKSSVLACCEFIYPRLVAGGVMIFDDYGHATCPGARAAVDEFFADKPENPLTLDHGQAIVFKLPGVKSL